MVYSTYKEFINSKNLFEADSDDDSDLNDIYLKADRTKVVSALNSAISALPGIIGSLKNISDQLERSGINGSRPKTASESLAKYLDRLKKELNP